MDDHPLVRVGLVGLVNAEPDMEICGDTGSTVDALRLAETTEPDVVIVDLSLSDGNGLTLIKRLRSNNSAVKTLVCSMHDESLFAQRALNAGARGYINKQEATRHVVSAIRRVLDGKIYLSDRMTEQTLLNAARRGAGPMHRSVELLTDREFEVFELIGQCKGTSEIAEKLHISVKTIETHREKIKRKLNLRSGAELTRRAIHWAINET
ncbi:MAG: response regulator transcription factor [Pseudomonadota bacterium]|nr:response regulator transcription factor [Pseudomonadota bacterium]